MEYGGCIAAEALGLPHASIAGNAYAAIDSPEINYFPGNRRMVAEPLARHREEVGPPPDPETEMPFRHLHLCFMPPTWDDFRTQAPQRALPATYQHGVAGGRVARLGRTPARPPNCVRQPRDRLQQDPRRLEAIVEALAAEPINVIVAIGRDQDPGRFGPEPDHVRLEAYVPQPLLLAHCDAFVTHGGFNSIKEALSSGVPMVVVPISADQPYSAERCADLGVARTLGPDDRAPDIIREAVQQVLADPSYHDDARAFQAKMRALPGPEEMVEMIESLRG